MKNVEFNFTGDPFANTDAPELIIREGAALPLHEPQVVHIVGVLDSPLRWLEQRLVEINLLQSHVLVSRSDMRIKLSIDETSYYVTTITGGLELHPMFKLFGVNTDRYLSHFDMAKLFKMNRTAFENHSVAMQLVSELQNFKAKVNREIEKSDNNRGDRRELLNQIVESNLPEKFNLVMPIFKGTPPKVFEVEVYVKPDDFTCTLISPGANELVEFMRDTEIDAVLDGIRELAPTLVIIEQ